MQSNLPDRPPEENSGIHSKVYDRARKSPVFLLFLLLMLPVGIFAIQKATSLFSRAQTPPQVSVSFAPSTASVPPAQQVKINLDAGSNQLAFARVVFTFDKSKVKLASEITTTSKMSTVVQKSTMSQANGDGKVTIVIAASPSDTKPSGSFEFASFSLNSATSNAGGASTVAFSVAEMQIVNVGGTVLTATPSNLAVNGATGGGGNQDPTPTQSAVALPPPNSNPSQACTNIGTTSCFVQWVREFSGAETTKYSDKVVDGKIDLQDFEKIRRALHP